MDAGVRTVRPLWRFAILAVVSSATAIAPSWSGDWPAWRGPGGLGIGQETGIVSRWTPNGENQIWFTRFIGRSTPVVFDGHVCASGRAGEGSIMQEVVACWDAESGRPLWERRLNVYHSTVPFNRVGWASVAADSETGMIYAHGVAGQLVAYDREGRTVWEHFLTEEYGHLSGYGGRTQTPVVDGDLVLLGFVSAGWGDQRLPRHRYHAFDKRTGSLVWVATPGGFPADFNTQSAPVFADIGGRRQIIAGDADGWVYGLSAANGETIWKFQVSKRALNVTPVVRANRVYICHSEENVDLPTMGRCVAIDATGGGNVTGTHEVWRHDEVEVGFASPALADETLYVIDNSGNLNGLDAKTGASKWAVNVGTVGKGSPVIADGKILTTEVNGRFHILAMAPGEPSALDFDELTVADGRYAEIYASPAVAYGRIYLMTEGGLYCIGDRTRPFARPAQRERTPPARKGEGPASAVVLVPAEVIVRPGQPVEFAVRAFDALGRPVDTPATTWTVEGLEGKIDERGRLLPLADKTFQTGTVIARLGALSAAARVRVIAGLPWSMDFESTAAGPAANWWVGAANKFPVVASEEPAGKFLRQGPVERGLDRTTVFFGPTSLAGYTIVADVRGGQRGQRRADIALINAGYSLELLGIHQALEIRPWTAEPSRLSVRLPFAWEPDRWYRMKLVVDVKGGVATIRGKVWALGTAEPPAFTIEAKDALPTVSGSPGLTAYHVVPVDYDNIEVLESQ